MRVTRGLERTRGRPNSIRGIVDFDGGYGTVNVESAGGHHLPVRKQSQRERPPLLIHRSCGGPSTCGRIVELGAANRAGVAVDGSSSGQDPPIREQDGGGCPASVRHRTGDTPATCGRIVQLRTGKEIEIAKASRGEDFSVWQQSRGSVLARDV